MMYKLCCSAILLCGLLAMRQTFLAFRVARFNEYLQKFNKSYSDQDLVMRMQNFEESLKEIQKLNSKEHGTGAVHGLTKFSDWSKEEIAKLMLKGTSSPPCTNEIVNSCPPRVSSWRTPFKKDRGYNDPDVFDWRDRGVIGPVQDQKKCNGCWAFSLVEVMEAMAAITWGVHDQLSVQELLDCADVTDHCEGGNIINALWFLCEYPFYITTEDKYPLKLVTQDCNPSRPSKGRAIDNYEVRCDVDDDFIKQNLFHGPVIVVINQSSWFSYNSGIITRNCVSDDLQMLHAVQVVGYGVSYDDEAEEIEFYIIKNSWGEDWGEDGYIRIAKGKDINLCGIRDHVAKLNVAE